MSRLPVGKIEKIIRPCGLSPQKSKAISGLSKLIVNKHNSKVPKNFKDLENLPGVGHKTASVVMSQAFGYPAFPVDTHIHRLAWRWGLSTGKNVEKTEKDLKRLFPESKWNKLHLQIIFYGREYCPARGHNLEVCIICSKYNISDVKKFPKNLSIEDILIRSSNIGTLLIARKVGEEKFKQFIDDTKILKTPDFQLEELGVPINFKWNKECFKK